MRPSKGANEEKSSTLWPRTGRREGSAEGGCQAGRKVVGGERDRKAKEASKRRGGRGRRLGMGGLPKRAKRDFDSEDGADPGVPFREPWHFTSDP